MASKPDKLDDCRAMLTLIRKELDKVEQFPADAGADESIAFRVHVECTEEMIVRHSYRLLNDIYCLLCDRPGIKERGDNAN